MSLRTVLLLLTVLLTIGGSASAESPELAGAAIGASDAVPELTSLLLLGTGLIAAASAGRRRQSQKREAR
jgi:hypothetical protein